jgi:hypothetical protein
MIDSAEGECEYAVYKNVVNEMYARDTSKKVRSAHRIRGSLGEPLGQPPYGYLKDPENPKKWIIDEEIAPIIKQIFDYCIQGKGIETTARLLQEQEILTPVNYLKNKGIGRGGVKIEKSPYKWCNTTVNKILNTVEYTGDIVNFKTYSKSYKDRKRRENPVENQKVFQDHHEAIIDRETFEMVQKLKKKTKKRAPKTVEKNLFADLVYCADCGSKLWFNVNSNNPDIHFFHCSNYKSNRGSCPKTHYIRADSLEQIVTLEVSKMINLLEKDKDRFVELLAKKTEKDMATSKKTIEAKLTTAKARIMQVSGLYEKVYEDNAVGKITDERFMQLSHKYDTEESTLRETIKSLEEELNKLELSAFSKDKFLEAIDKFMAEPKLNAHILRELIEKIEVYHVEGVGRSRTQNIVIHYRFIGVLEMPKRKPNESYNSQKDPDEHYVLESRQGVAINYQIKAS